MTLRVASEAAGEAASCYSDVSYLLLLDGTCVLV